MKVKWNIQEFENLRFDPQVQGYLMEKAEQLRDAAGGEDVGYRVLENKGRKNRAGATVIASTRHARRHNRKHRSLVKALAKVRSQ